MSDHRSFVLCPEKHCCSDEIQAAIGKKIGRTTYLIGEGVREDLPLLEVLDILSISKELQFHHPF